MDEQKLRAELTTDPEGLGYSGLSAAAATARLNDTTLRDIPRGVIDTWEILEATVPAEWVALSAAEKQRYQTFVGAGTLNVQGANVRATFLAMFAAGTQTRTNLAALQTRKGSRAEELGLGAVTVGDVQRARA